jgi:hypothetical protein
VAGACPALADEDVERLVALAPGVPVQAASSHPATAAAQASAAAPCIPAAVLFVEQSCVVQASLAAAELQLQVVAVPSE